jgi:hypothetical protein
MVPDRDRGVGADNVDVVPNDEPFHELVGLIERHGWAVRMVAPLLGEEGMTFAYTVGLTAMGHPEVVEQGLPNDVGQAFLNVVGEEVRRGRRFEAGSIVTDLSTGRQPVAFLRVGDTSGLTAVKLVYREVDALQLVWSDTAGRLPWEPGFGPGPDRQPLLGSWVES